MLNVYIFKTEQQKLFLLPHSRIAVAQVDRPSTNLRVAGSIPDCSSLRAKVPLRKILSRELLLMR